MLQLNDNNRYMKIENFRPFEKRARRKYVPTRTEKLRNISIENANEALLRRMVQIVNVSYSVFLILCYLEKKPIPSQQARSCQVQAQQ
jgi:hypothetical protein